MQIDIIACDGWMALYKDGVKVEEGHSISLITGLTALGVPATEWWLAADPFKVDLTGKFPDRLSER